MLRRKAKTINPAARDVKTKTKATGCAGTQQKKCADSFEWTIDRLNDFVSKRAYYIWQDMGKPQGEDLKIWRQAEKDILSQLIKK